MRTAAGRAASPLRVWPRGGMHERSSITDRRARPGGTCLSADPLTVDVQLGLMVTGSCVCVFVFARSCINIDFYIFFISLRRGRGGRLPRGGERHGTAGGAGARRGPDHPLRRHILLADPGHAVKKTHDGVKAGKPSRAETLGLLLWKDMRHKSSGPFEGRIQGRAPPPASLHCAGRSSSCQRAAPGRGSASASGPESHVSEFPELCHFFVPKAFSVKTASLGGRLTLKGFLLNF